jgi:hypothetical protein
MNKILILLLVLLSVSCGFSSKNNSTEQVNSNAVKTITVAPQSFIKKLPGKLAENSGIIFYDNLFWTINDSGGKNKIFAFNFEGKIEKEIEIEGATNIDWEDIAHDKKFIYVGDFGNNRGNRCNQTIYKIEKKKIGKKAKQKVKSKKIEFNFENQTNFTLRSKATSFDCEAVVEYNKSLYIFTKDWVNRTTTVYRIPRKKGEYSVQPIDTFNVNGLITGADISPDKTKLALVGYKDYKPIMWLFSNFTKENFWGDKQLHFEMDPIFDAQTEGVCFFGNDTILISCEATKTFRQQVFLIDLNKLQ